MTIHMAEVRYILNVLATVLGPERFNKFVEFVDEDTYHLFAQEASKKNSEINPHLY